MQLTCQLLVIFIQCLLRNLELSSELLQLCEFLLEGKFLVAFLFYLSVEVLNCISTAKQKHISLLSFACWLLSVIIS